MYRDRDTTANPWSILVYPGGPGSSVGRALTLHARGPGFKCPFGQEFFHVKDSWLSGLFVDQGATKPLFGLPCI